MTEKDVFLLNTTSGPTDIKVGDVWAYGKEERKQLALILGEGEINLPPLVPRNAYMVPVFALRLQRKQKWNFTNFTGSEEFWHLVSRLDSDFHTLGEEDI